MTEQDTLLAILRQCRTIAVVGLSPKPHRASYDVSHAMQAAGYRIIPVNPLAREVLGEPAYPSLHAAAQHHTIELVNCFRNSEDIAPIVDEAIAIGAKPSGCSSASATTQPQPKPRRPACWWCKTAA